MSQGNQLDNGEILSTEKSTKDALFKIPMENQNTAKTEDLQIASRTRSKLCLEQTSIEAIQSEFIPPDLEETTNFVSNNTDAIDNYWTEFLNDFMMPFSKILKLFIFETHHYYYF